MREDDELLEWLQHEEREPLEGWDFSHIAHRGKEGELPWRYRDLVREAISTARSMLDMSTGGGEVLASLVPLPPDTRATEGYPPNIRVARHRLEPLGVRVHAVDDWRILPFPDSTFDLVTNRHGPYIPAEVRRVLRPGGTFITQQVGGTNNLGLNKLLGAGEPDRSFMPEWWNLSHAQAEVEAAGLTIVTALEAFPPTRFLDVGAIVYWLKAIPWQIPDFSVDRYFDRLKTLHLTVQTQGYIEVASHRFLLIAENRN
jgi:SAM-dependent methyltransferase